MKLRGAPVAASKIKSAGKSTRQLWPGLWPLGKGAVGRSREDKGQFDCGPVGVEQPEDRRAGNRLLDQISQSGGLWLRMHG